MARKHRHPEHENHERWLISYADFITLLFAFFVVMFASSQTDRSKAQQVSDSVNAAIKNGATTRPEVRTVLGGTVDNNGSGNAMMRGPGGTEKALVPKQETGAIPPSKVAVTDLMPSMKYLNQTLASDIKDGKIEVRLEARGLIISLRQATFFPSGGDEIAPQSYSTLQKIADMLKTLPNPIRLEGHTDSLPIHTDHFHSNWELSAARSIAMLEVLSGRFGVPGSRFGISGYADTTPVDTNETEEGRAHNRRVDIAILNQQVVVKEADAAVAAGPPSRATAARAAAAPK
jgi:chemotaxis protein MotB